MGIIIKPIVTEKQTAITEKFPNRYGFRVSPDANKLEIKKAVEDMYSVTVVDVNTCLLYTSPSPRDGLLSRMPSSA